MRFFLSLSLSFLVSSGAFAEAAKVVPLDGDVAIFKVETVAYLASDLSSLVRDLQIADCAQGGKSRLAERVGAAEWPSPPSASVFLEEGGKAIKKDWKAKVEKLLPVAKLLQYGRENLWPQGVQSPGPLSAACAKRFFETQGHWGEIIKLEEFVRTRFFSKKGEGLDEYRKFMASLDKKYPHEWYDGR